VGTRFSTPVQTDPVTHPASCTMGTESFPGVKWPGCGVDHPLPTSAGVKERVETYIYSRSRHYCAFLKRTVFLRIFPPRHFRISKYVSLPSPLLLLPAARNPTRSLVQIGQVVQMIKRGHKDHGDLSCLFNSYSRTVRVVHGSPARGPHAACQLVSSGPLPHL
jgi:hypothetical protein